LPRSFSTRKLHSKGSSRVRLRFERPRIIKVDRPVVHIVPNGVLAFIARPIDAPMDVIPVLSDITLANGKVDAVGEVGREVVVTPAESERLIFGCKYAQGVCSLYAVFFGVECLVGVKSKAVAEFPGGLVRGS
jgi:hypothetical protein